MRVLGVASVLVLVLGVPFVGPVAAAQPSPQGCPIPIGPAAAGVSPQCGSPPPCSPSTVTLTFRIYQGYGQINFNGGGPYRDGDSVTVQAGCGQAYGISAVSGSVPSGYAFWEWVSDAGTFGDKTAASTNFTPGRSSGTISMVLTET